MKMIGTISPTIGKIYYRSDTMNTKTNGKQLYLYTTYFADSKGGDEYAIPQFLSLFRYYLPHSLTGRYGNDIELTIQSVENSLKICIEYEYGDEYGGSFRRYQLECGINFTPNDQYHYAYSTNAMYRNYEGDLPYATDEQITSLFNCFSIGWRDDTMRSKGYVADFNINDDDSKITYNGRHCTITEYISEAFNLKSELRPFTGRIDTLLYPHDAGIIREAEAKKKQSDDFAKRYFDSLR